MMKSAMIGAVAGFLAFVAAWVGWAYVTGKLDGANAVAARAAKPQDAQVALPAAATPIGSSKVRRDDDGSPVAVAQRGEPLEARSAPAVSAPSVPAPAAPAPAVAAPAVVPVVVPLLPNSPAVPPAALIAPAALRATPDADCIAQPPVLAHVEVAAVVPAVPPAASAVHTVEPVVVEPQPTRSEAEVARSEQAIAKFAAAQEALRNFRLQMPAKQAPATVAVAAAPSAAVVVPEAKPVPKDSVPAAEAAPVRAPAVATAAATSVSPAVRSATRRRAPAAPAPVVAASVASAPIPLVSFPGKNPGDAAGLAELDLLSRATDAMKRLSKKLGSPRIR